MLSVAFALLVPKCPMCLVAYLSLLGIGGLATLAHPMLRALSIALVALPIALVALAIGAVLLEQARRRGARSAGARAAP